MLCAMCVCIYVLITICNGESPFSEADIPSASQKDSVKTRQYWLGWRVTHEELNVMSKQ
jgi:hypothetical protein